MTTQKQFKQRVRERMTKTGESYAAARRHVEPKRARVEAARTRLSTPDGLPSDERIHEATGRHWEEWFAILDRWGARSRKHGETVDHLMAEHGTTGWWSQSITNGYERARGLRLKHQQKDGFTVYASKTVSVPIDVLFDAFVDAPLRERWLTDGSMSPRSSQRGKVARFEWEDGPTRVEVTFDAKGPDRTTAAVAHQRLPDPDAAEGAKAAWRVRLGVLKVFLESPAPAA